MWDIYDKDRNNLGITKARGSKLEDNEYHLVCNAWVKSNENKYLISQRAITKSFPLMWECTGGSVLSGENTLQASCRELKEELGLTVDSTKAKLIGTTNRHYAGCNDILDVWLFESNVSENELVLQKDEVNSAKWCTKEEILELKKQDKFETNAFFNEIIGD